jgi:predicted secreted Zn-dependent protease
LTEAKPHIQEPLYSALERLWKRFSAAANRRTEVAHCTYLADNKSAMRLLLTGKRIAFIPLGSFAADQKTATTE